jgi:hypothetical protein
LGACPPAADTPQPRGFAALGLQAWQNSRTTLAVDRGDTAISLVKVS